MTRKWPLPIAGSRTLRSRTASAGSSGSRSACRSGLGRRSLLSCFDFSLNRFEALLDERFEGVIDDQIDELLGRVEAAAVLAGVGIGPDSDLAGVVEDRLPLQEPLVDRAELLDGHVAVVDEAAARIAAGRIRW